MFTWTVFEHLLDRLVVRVLAPLPDNALRRFDDITDLGLAGPTALSEALGVHRTTLFRNRRKYEAKGAPGLRRARSDFIAVASDEANDVTGAVASGRSGLPPIDWRSSHAR